MPHATVTGTGWMGTAPQRLAMLLGSSETFRSVVGVSTEEQALQHIYFFEASDRAGEEDPKPRAVIAVTDFMVRNQSAGGWWGEGGLALVLEFIPPPQYADNPSDSYIWFINTVGAIVKEMSERAGTNIVNGGSGTYLNMREWIVLEGPAPCVPDEEDGELFYSVIAVVNWVG